MDADTGGHFARGRTPRAVWRNVDCITYIRHRADWPIVQGRLGPVAFCNGGERGWKGLEVERYMEDGMEGGKSRCPGWW